MTPELSVVVPTLNERENVRRLVACLERVLRGIAWEVIFVDDDSDDGTLAILHDLARRDPRVRYIHRIGRTGLSSACLEGMASTSSPFLAVMDADLQHDERLLPRMLETLRRDEADLVVGSRYVDGGGVGGWSGLRQLLSRSATLLAQPLLHIPLKDPMSGFFMLTRDLYQRSIRRVSGQGFKLLLDILASASGPVRVKELPFEFRSRTSGASKLDALVIYEYFLLLADKLVGRYVPVCFVVFCTVGGLGALLHLSILGSLLYLAGESFVFAQTIATVVAMTTNFTLNNIFTYRAQQLKGWNFLSGLFSFLAVCAIGAFVNIQIASYLYGLHVPWWGAGLMGAVIGAVWNYGVSSLVVWSKRSKSRSAEPQPLEDPSRLQPRSATGS